MFQIVSYGMSEKLGPLAFRKPDGSQLVFGRPYSEATQVLIDQEVRELVRRAYTFTEQLLRSKIDELEKVAQKLLRDEVISQNKVRELIGDRPFPMDSHEREYFEQSVLPPDNVVAAFEAETDELLPEEASKSLSTEELAIREKVDAQMRKHADALKATASKLDTSSTDAAANANATATDSTPPSAAAASKEPKDPNKPKSKKKHSSDKDTQQ